RCRLRYGVAGFHEWTWGTVGGRARGEVGFHRSGVALEAAAWGVFSAQAWRWKQRLGGSMRQGGLNAAACVYALDHHIDRLAEDHANAASLARGMAQIPGITGEIPRTNLGSFDTKGTGMTAAVFAGKLRQAGVMVSVSDTFRGRACLHLDVTAPMV